MRLVEVSITRSEHSTIIEFFGAWEIPVLKAVHGEENVVETGRVKDVDREVPDAKAEFDRLARRYGVDKEDSGQPWASLAYAGARGIRDLQLAIDESQEGVAEEAASLL